MKKLKIVVFILVFAQQAFGSEFWIGTTRSVTREQIDEIAEKYRTQIKDGYFSSSFDFLIGHPASDSQMAVILDLDSSARAASLNGLFQKAFDQYQKLEEKLKNLPRVSGLEKIELSTRVSLAHMATILKLKTADILWKEAHSWAPDAILSPEEFSPAVILQFSKTENRFKKTPVHISSSEESFVFVDGQRVKKPFQVSLEAGHHQVSVLGQGTGWAFKNFEVKESTQNLDFKVFPRAFVAGQCNDPQFVGAKIPSRIKLLVAFDETCPRVYSENNWYTLDGVKVEKINTMAKISDDLKPGQDGGLLSNQSESKPDLLKTLTKSRWFWVGLGAVVVGAVVAISSSNQTTTVPTHSVQ